MSDEEQGLPERPNAKYNLSKPDNAISSEETLNFHYNREHRLAKAPKEVQDLYREQNKSRFGLFGALIADRPRRMLFISIILLCAVILTLSSLGFFDRKFMLDGNRISVTGTSFEGITIIVIRKTAQNARAYTGAVNVAVFLAQEPEDEQFNYYPLRIEFTMDREQEYRFAAPFDSEVLQIILQTEKDDRLYMSFKPE